MRKDSKCHGLGIAFLMLLLRIPIALADHHLPARFSAEAYTGVYTVGAADLMLSIDGDEVHNLFVDPQVAYGTDQQWLADLGLGYRWISNDAAILGWYAYAGRTRVNNNSDFWLANPGVEVLGRRWDAHLNVYIPLAGRSAEVDDHVHLNSVSESFFTGHSEVIVSVFDLANEIQRVGNGTDVMLAYQLFRAVPLKAYLGAYYFDISGAEKLRGGIAGFQYWFDQNIKFFTNYSYDNFQRSTVVAGLGVSFGGVNNHRADPSLSERLTDPVEHYLSNWGHGSGIPSRTLFFPEGQGTSRELFSDNLAFFTQTGSPNNGGMGLTSANCTFENPCAPSDFSQTGVNTLNNLLPNTTMFFNGGNYPALDTAGTGPITLNAGQSISSRSADFTVAASGTNRSTFNGAFILNSNNTLNDIILLPTINTVTNNAIEATNASNVSVNGSQIGSAANRFIGTNLLFLDSSELDLNNSTLFSSGRAVRAQRDSTLTIRSSQIDVTRPSGSITGISVSGSSFVEISHSQINVTGQADVTGINVLSNSFVGIDSSDISVTSNSTSPPPNLALLTALITDGGGEIDMELGSLSLTGITANALFTEGDQIGLFGVSCTQNGSSVACN